MQILFRMMLVLALLVPLSGCLGTVVGAAVDTTIEVVKIPFKVVGAAVDVVTGDDLAQQSTNTSSVAHEDAIVLQGESEGIH